jgi:ATP-dependent Clp protease ATP-binding subunit ClpC
MEFENQNNQNGRVCDLCGEPPAVVDVMYVAGGERRHGGLCAQCARDALAQQEQLGGGPDGAPGPSLTDAFGAATPVGPPLAGAGQAADPRTAARQRSTTPALDRFGHDLTAEAREGGIDPVIGREAEIGQVIEALSRRRKNNAALIGEAGVGKTAIAEGLALRIAHNDVPEPLCGVRVVALDLSGMVAGTQFRGRSSSA